MQQRIVLAEPAGQTAVGRALERLGLRVDVIAMPMVDKATHEPEQLAAQPPLVSGITAMVLAIAPQDKGSSSTVDWTAKVHEPLRRCFTIIRSIVPPFVTQPGGGSLVVVLPWTALSAESGSCAESVLGRCLIGLTEGLKAELLATAARVTIVITEEGEGDAGLARQLDAALRDGPLYVVPASVTEELILTVFDPWLRTLARTPSHHALPPLGPMGEVYRTQSRGTGTARVSLRGTAGGSGVMVKPTQSRQR